MTNTPDTTDLTNKQLIEKVAVDVMGWRRCTDRKYEWLNPDGTWNRDDDEFDPLDNWENTAEVLDRCVELGQTWSLPITQIANQRVICKAALAAVSSKA